MSLKTIIVKIFLNKEVTALKSRLAEATAALKSIETKVVTIAKEAPAEAQALGKGILADILGSAHEVETVAGPVIADWAKDAIIAYHAGEADVKSVLSRAKTLFAESEALIKAKL